LKINEIEVQNFGPFYGKHNIKFKSGVNIAFGNNGTGKTFLFKAIGFALYGALFTNIKQDMINRRNLTHGGKYAKVTIDFDLLGTRYKIERIILKDGTVNTKLYNGTDQTLEGIYQKVPPHTAPFFLLDGEEVRQWVMSIGKSKWDTASIFGLSIYQGVIADLKVVKINLRDRINGIERRLGISSIRNRIKSINEDINQNKDLILKIKKEIIKLDEVTNDLKKLRSRVKSYKSILEKNKRFELEIKRLKGNINQDWKRARIRAQLLPYAIIKDQFNEALEFIEHMKKVSFDARLEQGRLDAQMELLGGIYHSEECICGRTLAASKFGKNSISNLVEELDHDINKFEKAAKAEYWPTMELIEMRSKVDLAERAAIEFHKYLKNIRQQESTLGLRKRTKKESKTELDEIEQKILILLGNNRSLQVMIEKEAGYV